MACLRTTRVCESAVFCKVVDVMNALYWTAAKRGERLFLVVADSPISHNKCLVWIAK